jgi:hypothetical protein
VDLVTEDVGHQAGLIGPRTTDGCRFRTLLAGHVTSWGLFGV